MKSVDLQSIEGTIETANALIWYTIFYTENSKNKTPLLCLHGGPGSVHDYLLPLKELATECPVIFYDQSGCGYSKMKDPNFFDWTLEHYVKELNSVIDGLGYKKVNLLGHSFGAMLATNYTCRHLEKIESLLLSAPCISAPQWISDCRKLAKTLPNNVCDIMVQHESDETTYAPEYQEAVGIFYNNFFCRVQPWPQALHDSMSKLNRDIYHKMWGSYEMTATGSLKDVDLSNQLSKITVPTLLFCGEYDMATPDTTRQYQKMMPNAELVVIENAAHMLTLEQPDACKKTIQEFLTVHSLMADHA